jgi:hypothetical protein
MAIALVWMALALYLSIASGWLVGIFQVFDRPAYNRVRIDDDGKQRVRRIKR